MENKLEKIYYEVKKNIDNVDFYELWDNFKPIKFALFNDKECFYNGKYIEKTEEFIANTAVYFNNEIIATWYLDDEFDSVILTSKIIHEMFHGFQMKNNETNFPNELEALFNYKNNEENLSLKLKENKIIYELINKFDLKKYNELLKIRKYRSVKYPYEFQYETKVEQIEGTANFVELMSLKQLSRDLFNKKIELMKNNIINKNNLIPVRIISYNIGALLLYIMKENNINYDKSSFSINIFNNMIKNIEYKEVIFDTNIKEVIDNYYNNANKMITDAISKNEVVFEGLCDLYGVNIYNAIYCNNYIISTYFVMYGNDDNKTILNGDFVIETKEYKKVSKIYKL